MLLEKVIVPKQSVVSWMFVEVNYLEKCILVKY